MIIIAPVLTGIVLAVIYTCIVHRRAPSDKWAWWHTLVATVVSALIAVSVAFLVYEFQQRQQANAARARYRSLLSLEISQVQSLLKDSSRTTLTTRTGRKLSVRVFYLETPVLEEAGRSGLFGEKATFMMLDLAGSAKMWNMKTDQLSAACHSAVPPEAQDAAIDWANTNLTMSASSILNGTTMLCELLGIEVKTNIKKYY